MSAAGIREDTTDAMFPGVRIRDAAGRQARDEAIMLDRLVETLRLASFRSYLAATVISMSALVPNILALVGSDVPSALQRIRPGHSWPAITGLETQYGRTGTRTNRKVKVNGTYVKRPAPMMGDAVLPEGALGDYVEAKIFGGSRRSGRSRCHPASTGRSSHRARKRPATASDAPTTCVTAQQALIHALFRKHRSASVVARELGISQIRVREGLVQHQRNLLRDAGLKPPPLKEMHRGDVVTRFGVPRSESGGRPAKHIQIERGISAHDRDGQLPLVVPAAVPSAGVLRLIVTAVEPDSAIHDGFWANLKAYAAAVSDRIIVVRTSAVATRADLSSEVGRHVVDQAIVVDGLVDIAADEPPASRLARPLDGVRHRASARWTIFPSGMVQLETLQRLRADVRVDGDYEDATLNIILRAAIEAVTGHADGWDGHEPVPARIKLAVLTHVARAFDSRGDDADLPPSAARLLNPLRKLAI